MTDNKRHFQVFDYNLLINKLLIYLIDLSTRLHDMREVVNQFTYMSGYFMPP